MNTEEKEHSFINAKGPLAIGLAAIFALSGAVALGYVLLWMPGSSVKTLIDYLLPQEYAAREYTNEEKLQILLSIEADKNQIPEEEKRRALGSLAESNAEIPELEEKFEILRSLSVN